MSVSYDLHDRLAIGHATIASVAVLFILPSAILIARLCRSNPLWIRYHVLLQSLFLFLMTIGLALGMAAVSTQGLGTSFSGPNADLHHQIGLACYAMILTQGLVGVAARRVKPMLPEGGKHWLRKIHIGYGILVASMCYWVVWEGMHDEWTLMSDSMTLTPDAVQILFWILFAIPVFVYFVAVGTSGLGWINSPSGTRAEKENLIDCQVLGGEPSRGDEEEIVPASEK